MCVEVPHSTKVMTFSHFKCSSFEFIHTSIGAKQKIPTKTVTAHYCLNALSYFITKWTTSSQSSSSTQNVHRTAVWQDSEVSGHENVKKNSESLCQGLHFGHLVFCRFSCKVSSWFQMKTCNVVSLTTKGNC